jgi:NTE family protein
VRASISVPGVFEPYQMGERLLVDGGVVNPLPVSVARRHGADFVVAVQVPAPGKTSAGPSYTGQVRHNLLSIMLRTYYFGSDQLASQAAAEADLLIRPEVAHFGWRDYRSSPEIILSGYHAGQLAAGRIRAMLRERASKG